MNTAVSYKCDVVSWSKNDTVTNRKVRFPDVSKSATGNKKTVLNTADNLSALLQHMGYKIKRNAMNLELEVTKNDVMIFESFESLRSDLISCCVRSGLPKASIDDHLIALAEKNIEHSVKNWLDSERWDGVERVEKLISCFNAKDPQFAQIVLYHWFIGCVASLYEKNFSSKLVPILKSDQSYMKTAALSRICSVVPGSFLEGAELNPDIKDSVLSVIKSWIVELGELERTTKNNAGPLKAFITRRTDTIRPPYGRTDIHKPRQTHLIASVNGTNFLKDETGNNRFAVIELEKAVDIEKLNYLLGWQYNHGRVRLIKPHKLKQFWLEIKHSYDTGKSWNLSPEHLKMLAIQNDQYSDKGTWYDLLLERYVNVDDTKSIKRSIKASELCEIERIDKRYSRQLGQALTRLADEGKITRKKGRANSTFYELKFLLEREHD